MDSFIFCRYFNKSYFLNFDIYIVKTNRVRHNEDKYTNLEVTNLRQEELFFSVFCIENIAKKTEKTPKEICNAMMEKTHILQDYILPCYDILHTQGKEYIVNDIVSLMKDKKVI